jgi:hypothetical protein
MVGAEKKESAGKGDAGAVAEDRARRGDDPSGLGPRQENLPEGQLAESEKGLRAAKGHQLADQERAAPGEFAGRRPVPGRRAARRSRHPAAGKLEAVLPRDRSCLVREAGAVERREEEVPGRVSGEDPSRPVASVCGGREPDNDQAGARIAETRHRLRPVLRAPEASRRVPGRGLAPPDEARTGAAGHDVARDGRERVLPAGSRPQYLIGFLGPAARVGVGAGRA